MQRRIALSLSLAFTTVVMFAMVTVGAQAGFFAEHKSANASQVAAVVPAPADVPPAAPAQEDPLIVTDYVYVDEPGAPVGVRVPRAASPEPPTPAPTAQSTRSDAAAQPVAPQPVAPPASQPPATAPAPAPAAAPNPPKREQESHDGERDDETERESGDD